MASYAEVQVQKCVEHNSACIAGALGSWICGIVHLTKQSFPFTRLAHWPASRRGLGRSRGSGAR